MATAIASQMNGSGNKENPKQKFHLIWLAKNIDELKKRHPPSFTQLRNIDKSMDTFTDTDLFVNFIIENSQEKILIIIDGTSGENTVPFIHDSPQVNSIFVFCHRKDHHEKWARHWSKIKGVFNQIDLMCQTIEQIVQPKSSIVNHRSSQREARRERTTAFKDQSREHRRRGRSAAATPTETDTNVVKKRPERDTSMTSSRIKPDVKIEATKKDNATSLINSERHTTDSDELEHTLTLTTERELRKSLLLNNDIYLSPSIDTKAIDRLQDTLVQTIEKHVTKKPDDSNVLQRLFSDLKQVVVDTLVQQQQQPILSQDMIKQAVQEVLKEQKTSLPNLTTTNRQKPVTIAINRDIKISADLKKTRIDAAFRQERDAVVNNQRLRDTVQQWSSIKSMVDLVTTIRSYGKTNLEYAWLLFCWIAQNIQYQPYCNNNAAESVFRTRQGVCRGFVSLYHECCSLLNIQCLEISGYAKQAFLKPGEDLKQSAHAWNSIILDQYTYLIDPTWGAGGRDNNPNKLEDFYFLTSPEEFIYTHYCIGNQLLQPEISKNDFLSLPIMNSTYYQLGLKLLSPKQGFNQTNENLFKISIRTSTNIDLFIQLKIGDIEYPRNLHTLCQRDQNNSNVYNCYIAPPVNSLYTIGIFGKTKTETYYHEAISMRLRVLNIIDSITFPLIYSTFTEHHCLLIEPLQRIVYENEQILIHMIIPYANVIKIRNGEDYIVPSKDEYKKNILKKQVCVQGDVQICARWDDKADSISIICVFNML